MTVVMSQVNKVNKMKNFSTVNQKKG